MGLIEEANDEALCAAAANISASVFEREVWTYGSDEGRQPTEGELALTVARLLRHVREGAKSVTSGRFLVSIDSDGDVYVHLQLGLGGELDVS